MDFLPDIIEITGALILRLFRNSKTNLDDIIKTERSRVWIIGLIVWITFLTIFGAIAKYGFPA